MPTLLLLSLLAPARAADALSISAIHQVPAGTAPSLTLTANSDGDVQVHGSCDGHPVSAHRKLAAGDHLTVSLGVMPPGTHQCRFTVGLTDPTGGYGEMNVPLQVEVIEPLTVAVHEDDVDLDARTVTLHASRGLARVDLDVLGPDGHRIGGASVGLADERDPTVQWTQDPGTEAVKIELTAKDANGYGQKLELLPWHYRIPHVDVVFESGSDVIRDSEVGKFQDAWGRLQDAVAKYGAVMQVQLFVAGYTDTVGTAAYNQGLSERRARAIAGWFRQRGFSSPIWYQGFGETALATPTADDTPEAANRRAVYVLAAEPPTRGHDFPRSAWKKL